MSKTTKKLKKLAKVNSLWELFDLAAQDERYEKLLKSASANLGGPGVDDSMDACKQWLITNANELSEEGVIDEVNFCR